MYIQFLIFSKLVLKHVYYNRQFKKSSCFEQDEIHMEEIIENRKRLLIPWLYVESLLDAHLLFGRQENLFVSSGNVYQNHASFFVLKGYSKITRTHRMSPIKRGIYRLETVTLTSGDLLGLAKIIQKHELHQNNELVVYPKPLPLPFEHLSIHSFQGDVSVQRFILPDPFIVSGTRAYSPGDPLKQVNWKATARTGDLQVYQYDYTSNQKVMVLLNIDDNEKMWRAVTNTELIENYIRYSAGIIEKVLHSGLAAGFAANMRTMQTASTVWIEADSGQEHWEFILYQLACLQLERTQSFAQLLDELYEKQYRQMDFIIISSYWNEELELRANHIRQQQNSLLVVNLTDAYAGEEVDKLA